MTLNSHEHDEMMTFFERQSRHFPRFRIDREPRHMWPKGTIYQNGETNELFRAFRLGVAYGQATERDDG